MISAPVTHDEDERLQALYDYEVLDTEAEKAFNDLVNLASTICNTPISLISLVDPERQWFKAKVGVDACETHRDIAFCAHAILEREIFIVPDTLKDPRFVDNPLVTDHPNIRFYAGAQLVTPNGHAIGTLCVISNKPQTLDEHQRYALKILSRQVVSQLELRKRNRELQVESLRVTSFLSNISHELRTPLNAIIGFSHLLKEDIETLSPTQKTLDNLAHLDFSGERMLEIVNAVLDLSKIEAGKIDIHSRALEVHPFFRQLFGMMRVNADEKEILFTLKIENHVPDFIKIDDGKLSQIIINLCSNAIKFTHKRKEICLHIDVTEQLLVVKVTDQGIGVSEQELEKLFDKFHQVKKHGDVQGTGLGLAITKGLVEIMGGDIQIISRVGKGTTVTVSFPLQGLDDNDTAPIKTVRNHFPEVVALIVEDNEINQIVATEIMSHLGMQTELADDGESAVEKCKNNHYNVVFMDINLPGINGFEAAKIIKERQPRLPIIALTADVFETHRSNDIDDYLTKPIDKQKLSQSLTNLAHRF